MKLKILRAEDGERWLKLVAGCRTVDQVMQARDSLQAWYQAGHGPDTRWGKIDLLD